METVEVKEAVKTLAAAKYLVPANSSPEDPGVGIPGNVELVRRNAKLQEELARFRARLIPCMPSSKQWFET